MAAPGNVYVGSLPGVSTTGEQEVLITTSAESTSLLKDRFYLDYFICLDSTEGVGMQGKWAGACIVGSPNYYMHNIARHGWLEFYLNNEKYVVFWDAGLNTLGRVDNLEVLQQINIENFVAKIKSYSAFYVDGEYGLSLDINSQGWINSTYAFQQQNNVIETSKNNADLIEFNDTVKIKPYHSNAEGVYYGDEQLITIQAAPIIMKYDAVFASVANGSTVTTTYFYTIRGLLMSTLYLDERGNTQAPVGYYVAGGYWYEHAYSDVVNKNIIIRFGKAEPGQYPDGDPANPQAGYTVFNWYAYSSFNASGACTALRNPVDTYRRNSDGVHFTTNALTTIVPNGWYIEDALAKGWFNIQNGLIIDSGAC